jgi:hypothetical protein
MNKVTTTLTLLLLLTISAFSKTVTLRKFTNEKYPIVIEVMTKDTSISVALLAAKTELLKNKFITTGIMQGNGFIATRAVHSDCYFADVTATNVDDKVKLTISFVKVRTGLLNYKLQPLADKVKADLEK